MADDVLEAALVQCRPRLVRLAYRMMGTLDDAEDVVQDAYLRIRRADTARVEHPERYLVQTVVRQCLDRWKRARTARQQYIGPWLPEPVVEPAAADAAAQAELAESLSLAFLLLLESLDPVQRAVFLLHDVFNYEFAEIADIVGKSPENCRQIARRARQRLDARDARYRSTPAEQERLLEEFLDVCRTGDVARLAGLLADDARWHSDGGGKVAAARVSLVGRERIARFLAGLLGKAARQGIHVEYRRATVNGRPGALIVQEGRLHSILSIETADDRIEQLFLVLNPEKLRTGEALCEHAREEEPC